MNELLSQLDLSSNPIGNKGIIVISEAFASVNASQNKYSLEDEQRPEYEHRIQQSQL